MIQTHFVPLFAQDLPPPPPAMDISVVPPIIPVFNLEEDRVVPILVKDEVFDLLM